MAEKIDVQMVSDIITAKSGNKYFTLEDMGQKKYVCFNPKLHSFCSVGGAIEADIIAGKTADDSPLIEMIYVNGKAVVEVEKKVQRSFGKSDKELIQIRQLAEAQNRSIQAQTALNRAVDIAIAGQDVEGIEHNARTFYQLLQSLTLISEAEVIIKGAKDAKTTKEISDKEAVSEHTRMDDSGGGVKTAKELMNWAISHGKEYTPSWVKKEALLGDGEITEEVAQTAYQAIKAKMGW